MKLSRNVFLAALVVIVVVPVLVENVVLVRRMSKLQAMFSAATSRQEVPVLKVGDAVAPAVLQDLDGKPVNLSMDAPKILFIFSSNCRFCKENLANWKAIEQRVGKSNVLYLAVDPPEIVRPFAYEHHIEDETLLLSRTQAIALKSFRIPETIQASQGKVVGITIGVLTPEETNRIDLMN